MNERIRELRNEAEKWVDDNFSTDELGPYQWWEKEEQKFAELIVSECMDVVADCKGTNKFEHWTAIKEHFGVES